jgi:hypothetical protein
MAREPRKRKPVEPKAKKKTPEKGMTTEELRRKHMSDPNHNISEEDLKNVQIEAHAEPGEALDLPEGDERPHDVDKDHRIKTPWDVRRDS